MSAPLPWIRMAKNAFANVASGSSAALLAIVLPPILVRSLTRDVYATWVLILQIGAYTGLLSFGIQVAVGRFVAHYEEASEPEPLNELLSTAWAGLLASMVLGCAGILLTCLWVYRLFPQVPPALRPQAQEALAWVGVSLAMGLPFTVLMGTFIGRQKNEVPAFIQIGSRLATGIGLVAACAFKPSLLILARIFALVNLATYGIQLLTYHWCSHGYRIEIGRARLGAARKLWDYCFSLTVWSVASTMVSGLGVAIVGRMEFSAVGAYAIAAGLVTFIAGFQNSIFNVMIPVSAVLGVSADRQGLRDLLLDGTRYGVLLLLASGLPLLLGGEFVIRHYVGDAYVAQTLPVLRLLVVGNMIRLVATPYASLLVGTGQQRLVLFSPLAEGISNVLSSIVLSYWLGARGVAIGTIVGALVGLMFHIFYNFPRTSQIPVRAKEFLQRGILLPLVPGLPWLAASVLVRAARFQGSLAGVSYLLAFVASALLLWKIALSRKETTLLLGWLK